MKGVNGLKCGQFRSSILVILRFEQSQKEVNEVVKQV